MGKYKVLLLIGLFLSANAAFASINLNVNTGNTTADAILKAEIDKQFQVPNMTEFLKSMSNAQSVTNKGQGVSYATEHTLFVVGGGFGLGINSTSGFEFQSNGGLPPIGLGVQGSVMAGVSLSKLPVPALGPVDLKRITIFVNYFGISNDSLVNSVTIKANTFGLHAQYKLIEGKNLGGIGILNWGGLAFTTGFDVSSNSLTYKVGQSISASSSGLTYTWTPNSASNLTLESNSFSIPFEISTSARVLYVASVFAGVGVDLNFGKSSVVANLDGPVTGTGMTASSKASLTGSEDKGPSFGQLRFFFGPQLNLVPLKNTNLLSIYTQVNVSTGGSYGLHAGARIAW